MARRSICSVLQVKPFSGYYRSCPTCKRKLGDVKFNSIPLQKNGYWCRSCCVDLSVKELRLCYCLILTVTDYPSGMMTVSLFGRALESIFGLPAAQMYKYLDLLEGDEMTKHELLLKALRTLLIGACVELTFARGSDIHHTGTGNGQTMKMASCVASGVKLLGASNNETVLSLLIAQALSQKSTASPFIREGSEERDTCTLAGANDSSLMTQVTQQNPLISRHNHNSSSFLYDTKSQTDDAVTQSTSHPLQLESFQETQSGCVSKSRNNCVAYYRIDDVPDIEASQQIVRELESEWENSQQIEQAYKQLPGDVDFDLALSEEVVSELQQTFDLSRELESTPLPATTTAKRCSLATVRAADTTLNIITPLPNFMATDAKSSDSTARTMPCYGSPELFSSCKPSHKKQTHLGRVGEQSLSSSFSPELFGPTPLVCRLSSSTANISATPSGPRSKIHTPKRSLLHDSTLTTPLCHVSQVSSIGSNSSKLDNLCVSTPQTQSKESSTISCTASSPDLFS